MICILLGIGLLFAFLFSRLIKAFRFWENLGVTQPGVWDSLANLVAGVMQKYAPTNVFMNIYNFFPDQRYAGVYQFTTPVLLLRDPDLIKQIAIKDFDHFVDHMQFTREDVDPLWGKNLFQLKGERWKEMRATLSPSFTSSKMRAMFELVTDCAKQFVRYFEQDNLKVIEVEMKDVFTRYTNDVIASAAFGITCNSLKERDNEFYLMGKAATNFGSFRQLMKFLLMLLVPKLSKFLGLQLFSKEVSAFFRKTVKDNIETREKDGIIRHDMIHLLMEARKGRLKHEDSLNGVLDSGFAVIEESAMGKESKHQKQHLSDDDITAQALIFFFAGFESVSTLICFAAYELAINPDIQARLQNEIDDTLQECDENLTYEALLKMKYLDMVVSEALRKWPVTVAVDRECVIPYVLQPTKKGEKPIRLEKGQLVWFPIIGIHRDPKFYPEPERFDPERFSDENKGSIYPYSYLPFGAGPRSCIGNRFALLETKTVLFYTLAKFDIVVIEKTPIPLILSRKSFNPNAEGGFWMGLKPRKHV